MDLLQDSYVCRVKVFREKQSRLFKDNNISVQELLKQAVESKPRVKLKRDIEWSIGNVKPIDRDAIFFKLGREKKTVVGVADEFSGDYSDEFVTIRPNTDVVLDWRQELLSFIPFSELCSKEEFPRRLKEVLNNSDFAKEYALSFEIELIDDPTDFISWLKSAHQITQFAISFTPPNLLDTDKDFIDPLNRYAEAMNASPGNNMIKVSNEDGLNSETVIKLVKDRAASADRAYAWARHTPKAKARKKKMRGSHAVIQTNGTDSPENRMDTLRKLREYYARIRE